MIQALQKRFREYALSFLCDDASRNANIKLKLAHTFRVWRECRFLSIRENFSQQERLLVEFAAMLHDLSRFEQIQRFNTFRDAISFDHGKRSAELALNDGWLPPALPDSQQQDILCAIAGHNQLTIPAGFSQTGKRLCGAVRDGDKLDIMRILLHHLEQPDNETITFGMPFQIQLTPTVAEAMRIGLSPRHEDMRSSTDFLAAKFMWASDLNFQSSCELWQKRKYHQKLFLHLPQTAEIRFFYLQAERELEKRLKIH